MRRGFKIWQSALRVKLALGRLRGARRRSYAAFLRPEATYDAFEPTFVNFLSILVPYMPLSSVSPQRRLRRCYAAGARVSTPSTPQVHACRMARRLLVALACIGAAEAGSALAEGTTPLTAANFDDFVEGALAAGKTAMVRFIASEG